MLKRTLAVALALGAGSLGALAAVPGVAGAITPCTGPDGITITPAGGTTPGTTTYCSIGAAIAAADNGDTGDTINIPAGTYVEQVNVSKPVTIDGAGQGQTIIQSPAHDGTLAAAQNASGPISVSGQTEMPVVFLEPGSGNRANLQQLTVDAAPADASTSTDNCGSDIIGVLAYDSSDTVQNVTVTGAAPVDNSNAPDLGGCQDGKGIEAYQDSLDPASETATIASNTISGYQKDGIAARTDAASTPLTANIGDNTVTGTPSTEIASNGIEAVGGGGGTTGSALTGSISGNTVTGNECSLAGTCSDNPNDTQATGILSFDAQPTISGNTVYGNDIGITGYDSQGGSLTITGNVMNGAGNRYYGIEASDGTESDSGNTISGSEVGVEVLSDLSSATPTVLTGNAITNNSAAGIRVDNGGGATDLTAAENRIADNATGILNNSNDAVTATNNWWGCNAGPTISGGNGCDTVTGSGGKVTVSPPMQLTLTAVNPSPFTDGGTYGGVEAIVTDGSTSDDHSQFPFPNDGSSVSVTSSDSNVLSALPTSPTGGTLPILLQSGSNPGTATITIQLDNQKVPTPAVQIVAPATSSSGGSNAGNQSTTTTTTPIVPLSTTPTETAVPVPVPVVQTVYVPVYTNASKGGTTGSSSGPRATVSLANGKSVTSGPVLVSKSGLITLSLSDPTGAAQQVQIFFTLKSGGKTKVLAAKGINYGDIKKLPLHVRMTSAGFKLLKSSGQLKVTYTAVLNGKTTAKTVTLKAPKRK